METPFDLLLTRLATNMRALRQKAGLSQEALALEAGVDRTYVSQIERSISNPSLLVLHKLAQVLKTSIPTLLQ